LARERENVDKRVGELDGQIKSADKDLHEVDELASKSDAKVLNIQKQIIALNNEIDQVEEKVKGLVLEGDRTKEAMTRLESQLAHVETQYETAIVTSAGARMQAIIVDDDTVAAQCIDYLKKRKVGRATFLPLNKMLVGKPRGKAILVAKECLGFAIDLCHFDEKYRDSFFYVFGDTLVVQTLDEARKWMGGVRREARVRGQGPRGPERTVRGRADDRDADRRGPDQIHERRRRPEGETGRAQEGRHGGDAPADLLSDEGSHEPPGRLRGGAQRPTVETRGDDDPDDVPRRAPDGTGHADRKLGGSKEGAREADRGLRGGPRAARDG